MRPSLLARCPLRWRHGRARALFAFTAFLRHDSAAARDKFSALQLASGCRRAALTNGGLALCRQPGGVTCRGTPAAAAESRRASRLSRRPIALPRDAPQNLLISPCDVQSQMLLRQGMARNAVLSRASSVLHFQQRFMGAGPTGYGSGPYRGLKVPKSQSGTRTLPPPTAPSFGCGCSGAARMTGLPCWYAAHARLLDLCGRVVYLCAGRGLPFV